MPNAGLLPYKGLAKRKKKIQEQVQGMKANAQARATQMKSNAESLKSNAQSMKSAAQARAAQMKSNAQGMQRTARPARGQRPTVQRRRNFLGGIRRKLRRSDDGVMFRR